MLGPGMNPLSNYFYEIGQHQYVIVKTKQRTDMFNLTATLDIKVIFTNPNPIYHISMPSRYMVVHLIFT